MIRDNGKTWTSADGLAWTEGRVVNNEGGWTNFASVGDTWLAIRNASSAANTLQRSADRGGTWTLASAPFGPPIALAASSDAFFLVQSNPAGSIFRLHRSTDGAGWTEIPVSIDGVAINPRFILPLANTWWLLAQDNSVYRSTDNGATWTRHVVDTDPAAQLLDLQWSGSGFLASAYSPDSPRLYRSADGITWSPVTAPSSLSKTHVRAAGGGRFLIADGSTSYVSTDATNWTSLGGLPATPSTITCFNNEFYALSYGDLYRYSEGSAWTQIRTGLGLSPKTLKPIGGTLHAFDDQYLIPLHFGDISLQAITAPSGIYGIGDSISTTLTLANLGRTEFPELELDIYLSRDAFHGNSDDLRIGGVTVPASDLPLAGQTRSITVSLVLPPTLEGGQFRIGAHIDPRRLIGELNKANNRRLSAAPLLTVPEWTLNLQTNGEGSVGQSVSSVRYTHGSTVSLAPSAGKNSAFAGWSGSETSDRPDLTLTMNGNKSLVANFAAKRQLSISVQGAGEVRLDRQDGLYAHGAAASLTAVPASGWRFAGWSQDLSGSTPSSTLSMTTDRAVLARFDYPIENWRAAHFTAQELGDPAISGDLSAPGPSGVPNLLSYLAGRAPRAAGPLGDGPELQAGKFLYRFTRNTGAMGATLTAEISSDLATWTPAPAEHVIATENGIETVEVIVPRSGTASVFIRLRAKPTVD